MRRTTLASVALALGAIAQSAGADDRLPTPTRPVLLPQLTHRDVQIDLDTTGASVGTRDVAKGTGSISTAMVHRLAVEVPLGSKLFFVGAQYELAWGSSPSGRGIALGNPEVSARGVWGTASGTAFGGGLSFAIPTFGILPGSEQAAIGAAATAVRPWDRALFDPTSVALRPFLDLRNIDGPLTIQLRQTLELATDVRRVENVRFAAVLTFALALTLSERVGLGLGATEYYSLEPSISDASRSAFTLLGHVRIELGEASTYLGITTNIGSPIDAVARLGAPLSSTPTSFFGVVLGVTAQRTVTWTR